MLVLVGRRCAARMQTKAKLASPNRLRAAAFVRETRWSGRALRCWTGRVAVGGVDFDVGGAGLAAAACGPLLCTVAAIV